MRFRTTLLVSAALLLGAGAADAQVRWDSPMMALPRPDAGYGLYLFEPAGADIGVLGTMRSGNLRFRLGVAEGSGDDIAIVAGGDYVSLLRARRADFPLDIGWHLGVGVGFERWLTLGVPFGVSFGLPIDADGLTLLPFLAPRVVFDAFLGDEDVGEPSGTDLDFAADLGIEVRPSPSWAVRLAATLGDREGLAIGLIF